MPLIIESYYCPYTRIADLLFPGVEFQYIDEPISEPVGAETFYYTRMEIGREIKYYFNKIYYMEKGKIVCINKSGRQIKYYDSVTGQMILLKLGKEGVEAVDKSGYLPQLHAQEGELVLFPEEDDEI